MKFKQFKNKNNKENSKNKQKHKVLINKNNYIIITNNYKKQKYS